MDVLMYVLAIMFWVLLAIVCVCLCAICYIKLTYMKWDKEEKEFERFIKIHENFNSDYSERGR